MWSQMNGKEISLGPRQCSCNRKGEKDNVVVIDVDTDNCNNVIFVDVPEFLRDSSSKDEPYSPKTVICIDDEDYDENNNLDMGNFVRENNTTVKLSKCKRTYSGKTSASNRYGLDTDTDDDDDGPDFEFENFSGKLKQEWEKAFLRRQNEVFNRVDQASTSRFCSDSQQYFSKGEKTQRYADGSDFVSYTTHDELNRSSPVAMDNGKSENAFRDNGCKPSTVNREKSICNDQLFSSDHANTSSTKENASPEEETDNSNRQPFRDKSSESVFFNREKHKETDEYRLSVEAELAARQRELRIQAEEAQHLKRLQKRKRAESMRLLDMERRQKLRIEEIRETQKKDEENLNLKEQLRAEVKKDLDRLETTCHDMPSILRGLGINVNGLNEVNAAFKRALLTFHPDRASQSDIRQQVEAEEKFKLISRMKEKFLSS